MVNLMEGYPMTRDEIVALFIPHVLERTNVIRSGKRLVHYTSAEGAYRIISGSQIWLRNAQLMNDFSEIQYGISCLVEAWRSPAGEQLQAMLERISAGLRDELVHLFDSHADGLKMGTFIASLSEHEDNEDDYGRLSMWRAYGGKSGVALVLNNTAFAAATQEMRVFSSPVFYRDILGFVKWFQGWAGAIVEAEAKLKDLGAEATRNLFFMVFRSFALCTKHPAFAEEREWRVFHSPILEGRSDWIAPATEVVDGVPQLLMKLHLKDIPERGITGVAPPTLLNRVIIGPCEYPLQVREALADVLGDVGIANPLGIIGMSLIPYRQR